MNMINTVIIIPRIAEPSPSPAFTCAPKVAPPTVAHPNSDGFGLGGQHHDEQQQGSDARFVLKCKFPYLTIKEFDNLPKKHRKARQDIHSYILSTQFSLYQAVKC